MKLLSTVSITDRIVCVCVCVCVRERECVLEVVKNKGLSDWGRPLDLREDNRMD